MYSEKIRVKKPYFRSGRSKDCLLKNMEIKNEERSMNINKILGNIFKVISNP